VFDVTRYRNEKHLLNFDDSNIILRNAVRAVIIDNHKILMAYLVKTGEYKFPGGGVEENETSEEALKREIDKIDERKNV
jgi:8-oxo-dGTP pyrophosphatase MutT (NUDIX family)